MHKKSILPGLILCVIAVSSVHAAGVNLRWDRCYGDGGVANKTFACNTNSGSDIMVASFVLPAPQSAVLSVVTRFNLSTAGGALPAWWDVRNTGSCRPTSLLGNLVIGISAVACDDWAQGAGAGGLATYTVGTLGPGTASFWVGDAVNATQSQNLVAGFEYFTANILVQRQKTIGTGSCAGCSTPACIAIEDVEVGLGTVTTLTRPANGTDSNYVTWQGGAGVPPLPTGCPAAVPTRNSTWSSVKSLYR